jgi:3-hydroxybutyryl-CoA dehydrogenase
MINEIGVLGAGQMGGGIAHVFALSGYHVTLYDIAAAQLQRALAVIRQNLERQAKKEEIQGHVVDEALARISTTREIAGLAGSDFCIEAVTENEALKLELFAQLDGIVNPSAILASNTSSIPITKLASATGRPDRVIGMHFMNPVPVMKLVEVVRGHATSDDTFDATKLLVGHLDKEVALAQDYPGFIVNRVLIPMINEAIFALYEGVATPQDIDRGMKLGTNHPMGPLALADFIGLDTVLAICEVLYDGFRESKYRPCPLLVKMVNAGDLGRKTGRGFYSY